MIIFLGENNIAKQYFEKSNRFIITSYHHDNPNCNLQKNYILIIMEVDRNKLQQYRNTNK